MPAAWAMLAGTVASGFMGESTSGNKSRSKNTLFQDVLPHIRQLEARQRGQLEKGLDASLGGYDAAKLALSRGSRSARRSALDVAKEEQGELKARYGGASGMSTAFDMARSGLTARTTRRLQDVDQMFAQAMGGLEVGRGAAEMSGRQSISNLLGQTGAMEQDVMRKLYDIRSRGNFGSLGSSFQMDPSQGQGLDLSGLYSLLSDYQNKQKSGGGQKSGDVD